MSAALLFVLLVSLTALALAGWTRARVLERAEPPQLQELTHTLDRMASAYLARQSAGLAMLGGLLFIALLWFANVLTAIGLAIGVLCSAAAFYLIIRSSLRLAVRSSGLAEESERLRQASYAGRQQAAASMGLGLLGLAGFYAILVMMTPTGREIDLRPLLGLAAGITLVTLFARLGGELFASSAVRAHRELARDDQFPDDMRNPAAVIEAFGYNTGAHAGLVLELFSAFMLSLIGAMLMGDVLLGGSPLALQYPLMLAGFALAAFLAGELLVARPRTTTSVDEFFRTLFTAIGLALISFYILTLVFAHYVPQAGPGDQTLRLYTAALIGLGLAALVLFFALLADHLRVHGKLSVSPPAWQRLSGHSLLVLSLSAGLWLAHTLAQDYGLAIAILALQSLAAPLMVLAAYATLSLNATKLGVLSGAPAPAPGDELRRLERLVLIAARSFGLVGSALAALLLFGALVRLIQQSRPEFALALTDARVLAGVLLGGLLPYLFCAFNRNTVHQNALRLQQEVKRQFGLHPAILSGETPPDLLRPTELLARRTLSALAWPLLLPVGATLLIGLSIGPRGLTGAVGGAILSSLLITVVLRDATRAESQRRTDPKPKVFVEGYALGPAIGPVLAAICLTALLLVPLLE